MKFDLTILIVHYDRINCLENSLKSLYNIFGNSVKYLIADDGTPKDKLKSIEDNFNIKIARLSTNSGLGANLNNAINQIETKYVLQIQDDHYLKEIIDKSFIRNAISCFEKYNDLDIIRFLIPYNPGLFKSALEYATLFLLNVSMFPGFLRFCFIF